MTKRRNIQHALWLTAGLATVFFLHAPTLHIPPYRALLYILCVLLPQVVALAFQLGEVRERYEAFRISNAGRRFTVKPKSKPGRRRTAVFIADSFAMIKSNGINPNRAGPAPAAA